mmetsp:Transcript_20725/g.19769  ORF Transcript_20725/g.19769 Transcript_20725/m.19769 type:complete len:132 (-) Transcript_20725:1330-1725(-)
MWTNFIVVFSKLIEGAKFNGALQIYLLGIPIICVLVYTLRETRLKLLMTPENRIQRLVQCQKKIFYYLAIIESKDLDRKSSIILKGYVNQHVEVCPYEHCPLKAFKRQQQREKLSLDLEHKKKLLGQKNKS